MNALGYAKIAQAAYSAMPTIGHPDSAARAILSDTDDGHVISIPGTNNIACWLADLDAEVVQVNGLGGVHEGFWEAFTCIQPSLMMVSPAVVTGHSEGAALSLIYAAMLCLAGKPPKAVYAFEPPRISIDDTISQLLTAHAVRARLYRHGEDIVPLVPRLLHDWRHPAPLIQIGKASEPFPNVTDHYMEHVIEALSRPA